MRKNPIFIPMQIDFTNITEATTAVSAVVNAPSLSRTTGRKYANEDHVQKRQEIYDDDDDDDTGVLKDAAHNSSHNLVFVDILKNLWRAGASTVRRRQ